MAGWFWLRCPMVIGRRWLQEKGLMQLVAVTSLSLCVVSEPLLWSLHGILWASPQHGYLRTVRLLTQQLRTPSQGPTSLALEVISPSSRGESIDPITQWEECQSHIIRKAMDGRYPTFRNAICHRWPKANSLTQLRSIFLFINGTYTVLSFGFFSPTTCLQQCPATANQLQNKGKHKTQHHIQEER